MISLRRPLLRAGLLYFEAKLRAGFQVMLRVCELRLHVEERPAIRSLNYFSILLHFTKPEIGNCADALGMKGTEIGTRAGCAPLPPEISKGVHTR